ncbi:MAG TPA: DUF1800 domain-containing protein [Gemmataceae bacterium]|jgi:uncharacterized protein (DUF1800 family)|nr:DUF1800 domain-containing protein [Gemmataceae bacterium]
MSAAKPSWQAKDAWARYTPADRAPWNLRRVVHLHRRAGFAATWKELKRDLADGPDRSIDRLLKGRARDEGLQEDFQSIADMLATEANDPARLKAWWVYRMYWGPDPLGERLALMWHNHFATSNEKVNDLAAMRRQNEVLRRHARAPFAELLRAVVHDPALLIWLDAPANRKGQPNENLARELMELFTLGIGHYSEKDVKEAARALTGWKIGQGKFREWPPDQDDGEKVLLGHKGRWRGDDLVRMLLEHPATARRLAWRLCHTLMGEDAVGAADVDALAAGLREHQLDTGWAVETVLRSQAFFAGRNLGNRVAGPVQFVVGMPRALERFDPPPSSLVLGEWSARLGQDLFYPPNVGGWSGGRGWLTTQAIIGRANFAAALVEGELSSQPAPLDGIALAERHGRGRDLDDLLTFYAELLTGAPPAPAWRKRLHAALGRKAKRDRDTVACAVALLVASPEVQLA